MRRGDPEDGARMRLKPTTNRRTRKNGALPAVVALAAGLTAAPAPASASSVACDANALIAAIADANATPGPDAISLAPSCVYSFTAPYTASTPYTSWYGPSALPAIASSITIDGNGATIERNASATVPF